MLALHCRFEAAPSGLVVEDLESTNGTWVNGAAIVGPTRLRGGDVVVVGSTRILVDADGAPRGRAPRSAELDATVVRLRSSVVGGAVTVAFTDIVDSTAIGGGLGDREWFALLERHDHLTRRVLEIRRCGQAPGRRLHARVPVRAPGRRFGTTLQREFERQRRYDAGFPLHVRMGIHTGEVLQVDGDLFGRHVNIAAWVAGAAGTDEVLVSPLVHDLVSAMGDVEFGTPRESG